MVNFADSIKIAIKSIKATFRNLIIVKRTAYNISKCIFIFICRYKKNVNFWWKIPELKGCLTWIISFLDLLNLFLDPALSRGRGRGAFFPQSMRSPEKDLKLSLEKNFHELSNISKCNLKLMYLLMQVLFFFLVDSFFLISWYYLKTLISSNVDHLKEKSSTSLNLVTQKFNHNCKNDHS